MNWNDDNLNLSVTVGKYTVQQNADGYIRALRNGQQWRDDLTGCKLTLEMAFEIHALRERINKMEPDSARMDWIDNQCHALEFEDDERIAIRGEDGVEFTGNSFREAVDAALTPPADEDEG